MRFIYWAVAALPAALATPINPQNLQNLQNAVDPERLNNPLTIATGKDPISQLLRGFNNGKAFTSETPTPGGETPAPEGETPTPERETPTPEGETPTTEGETPTNQKRAPINPLEVVDGIARKVTGSSTGIVRRDSSGDVEAQKKKIGRRHGLFPFGGDVRGIHAGDAGIHANNLGREKRNGNDFPFNHKQEGEHSVVINPLLNSHGNNINHGFDRRDSENVPKEAKRNNDGFPFNHQQNAHTNTVIEPLLNTHGNTHNHGFDRREQAKRNGDEQNSRTNTVIDSLLNSHGNTKSHGFGRRESVDS
ncbi:hypothetical protein MGYG_06677 [Nannizzia gypsea CBS 118893]|uniref:Uncharacterized protein n=1 Tax=Arthroderma gypseum (strain ATCC MYA-4604 / CBS 118893) TaxID=535722 RepID=E4V0W5_ARTGP|nr:hypothetical protein MGYG_06677 [Nannizzia gypsea CBS 118893]EFR03680.1 hypothetical protein MGYG_06677 [Nannizzia gypsea CBS 118893]